MDAATTLAVVEGIYQAARGATPWRDVAAALADALDAASLGLRRIDPQEEIAEPFAGRHLTEPEHAALLRDVVPLGSGVARVGEGTAGEEAGAEGRPVAFASLPGVAGGVGIELLAVRAPGSPPFGGCPAALRSLASHLARASEFERDRLRAADVARCLEAGSGQTASAVLVVDGTLRIRARNPLARRLLHVGQCLGESEGRLVPRDADVEAALRRALTRPARTPLTLKPAHGAVASAPCLLLLQPLENAGVLDDAPSRRLLVVLSEACAFDGPDEETTRAFFGITPAEFRLAERLATGERLDDAARALRISVETARTYLKALFRKTGTARQAALVRRLLLTPRGVSAEVSRPERRAAR